MTNSGSPERQALVLDDSSAICALLRIVLERRGYRVHSFEDPEAALGYLHGGSGSMGVAVVDITLPGMSGVEFAGRLRALQPGTPLVLSSGRGPDEEQAAWIRRNGAYFLQKPFNLSRLDALLSEVEARVA